MKRHVFGDLDAIEHYEIHITVDAKNNVKRFIGTCAAIGVKPLVVNLTNPSDVLTHVMTSSRIKATPDGLLDNIKWIEQKLREYGWDTIRTKVETSPFHNAAPKHLSQAKTNQYFESHLPIVITEKDNIGAIKKLCWDLHIYLSNNAFKDDGCSRIVMGTYRASNVTSTMFVGHITHITEILKQNQVIMKDKPEVEFVIYDSFKEHDDLWIGG